MDDRNMPEDNEDIGPFFYERFEPEPEHPQSWTVDRGDVQPIYLKGMLDVLSDDERIELFSHYCVHCGSKDIPCYCSNDE